MRSDNILFLTKDALCKDYLPIYGNKLWSGKTPNLDQLAMSGTVFSRHYTAAPSTVMSFRAMMTGKFAYEQPYSDYSPKEVPSTQDDFFEYANTLGYASHIIWDETWNHMVLRYGNCFGQKTVIHSLDNIKQGVGCHYNHSNIISFNREKSLDTISRIYDETRKIVEHEDRCIIWIHLPHVINGCTSYGSDIDIFDMLIGLLRNLFDDNNIFISADHGNMNSHNGKYCYGFDVNTSSIEIPLITPKIDNKSFVDFPTSNVDVKELIFNRKIKKREVLFSDTAYYAQPHRILAIIRDNFIYIYHKETKKKELFDRENDRFLLCNLLKEEIFDPDRKIISPVRDYYYSPYWDNNYLIQEKFEMIRMGIWKNADFITEKKNKFVRNLKNFLVRFMKKKK